MTITYEYELARFRTALEFASSKALERFDDNIGVKKGWDNPEMKEHYEQELLKAASANDMESVINFAAMIDHINMVKKYNEEVA